MPPRRQTRRHTTNARGVGDGGEVRERHHLFQRHLRLHVAQRQVHAHGGDRPSERPLHHVRLHHRYVRRL